MIEQHQIDGVANALISLHSFATGAKADLGKARALVVEALAKLAAPVEHKPVPITPIPNPTVHVPIAPIVPTVHVEAKPTHVEPEKQPHVSSFQDMPKLGNISENVASSAGFKNPDSY